ncbi:hypothetical protein KSP39_PZI014235 [Platanthera zijinensis]|uniref:Uncharacterized protein n=1 Tax=Platanthera zijinensis TaxID=2320716 RepID=A0AAP0G2W5_9ASPA
MKKLPFRSPVGRSSSPVRRNMSQITGAYWEGNKQRNRERGVGKKLETGVEKRHEDGCLADFIDDGHWWVGLYSKLEGFSWRIWDGEPEQEVYVGAFIVNNKIIFPLEFDLDGRIAAQICVEEGLMVMGTSNHVWVMRVGSAMNVIEEMKIVKQTMYQMSTSNGKILLVDDVEAMNSVFDGTTLEKVSEFNLMERHEFHSNWRVSCMNMGFVIMWEDEIYGRVWDVEVGRCLYCLEPSP